MRFIHHVLLMFPEDEYLTRPRAFDPTEAAEEKGADDRPALGETIAAMRHTLKTGVQVVAAPQLFPTPADLAARMVELADVQPGQKVLEPSAGTGVLCRQQQDPAPAHVCRS